ncbi:Stk1 family PASTA domain-containing Ser/Thr kinase [Rhodococcus sp. D2-41]|uniref:non-specific serine/threonine protein kinase n=1 Tax=Speluncibacter jeojiensis TaxID=2710754 RepID=A0A9X4RGC0_9ACTN|nr:Stk1 family PASTA domain-containing Ser/Thr kinase [Rhodococcus sp. D2-41]MDG3012893.1 Stk1 family PASTA domain-containing Ser/Thr kinase [Rhodococcus sp. D2-41]MDG3017167.1 Stk1 family PASTA domain-containing Ser/Thr kinase [Corynebacteriales bacterium D3-21]
MTTPRELSDRYELGETLGFGGMSEVHLARDKRLDRDVAIKVLRADLARDPSFYLRFRREAQNAAALNHPSIVAVYDTGESETDAGPLPYIVMEYVDGETLRDIVRNDGPIPPRKAMEIVADVCAALDFSHRNGIVHRDMKPANIMINRAGAVKVMDFGIARAMSDGTSTMTQTAAVIGTAQYLSPEQARGESVDARSDVYSVGCVLFEILTGEPPFTGDSPVAVAYQHVREDPRAPSELNPAVPRELDSIVLKAMSKNPANRYQSAAEMRADLIKVLSGRRPSAPVVMNDEDRTTILGVPTDGRRSPQPVRPAAGVAVEPGESEDDKRTRSTVKILLGVLGVVFLGIVVAFAVALTRDSHDKVTVPDVSNKTSEAAQAQLQAMGLQVAKQSRPDATVPADTVISTSPTAGTGIDKNGTVTLNVSSGPQQVQVPQLTGMSQQDATNALQKLGLTVDPDIGHANSTADQLDKVVGQNPSAGSNVAQNGQVTLTLGSGPQLVRVPDVTGQTLSVAQPNIEGAGFKVIVSTADSPEAKGSVLSTNPSGGSMAPQGSTVTLTVSNGNRVSMPDLTGQTPQQALSSLKAAGWAGGQGQLSTSPVTTLDTTQVGKIQTQTQPPGSSIQKDSIVSVGVGQLGIPR